MESKLGFLSVDRTGPWSPHPASLSHVIALSWEHGMRGRVDLLFFDQDEELRSLYRTIPFPSSHGPRTRRPWRTGRPRRGRAAMLVGKDHRCAAVGYPNRTRYWVG